MLDMEFVKSLITYTEENAELIAKEVDEEGKPSSLAFCFGGNRVDVRIFVKCNRYLGNREVEGFPIFRKI